MNGKYLLGVTGGMSCGKTHTCFSLTDEAKQNGIESTYVNFDDVRREILGTTPKYASLRNSVADLFGKHILNGDGSIDRFSLSQIIFSEPEKMGAYKTVVYPQIIEEAQSRMRKGKGFILFEWGLLVEDGLYPLVDNNVLLVYCDQKKQLERLLPGSDLPHDQIMKRMRMQLSNEEKEKIIKKAQEKTKKGRLFKFDTTSNPSNGTYAALLEEIVGGLQ